VYPRHAQRVVDAITKAGFTFGSTRIFKGRHKSFEISIEKEQKAGADSAAAASSSKSARSVEVVWSGMKKGPPRALKFPDDAIIVAKIQEATRKA